MADLDGDDGDMVPLLCPLCGLVLRELLGPGGHSQASVCGRGHRWGDLELEEYVRQHLWGQGRGWLYNRSLN